VAAAVQRVGSEMDAQGFGRSEPLAKTCNLHDTHTVAGLTQIAVATGLTVSRFGLTRLEQVI
jgi:hypothetical protein